MTSQPYQQLNPLALAVAAGCTAIIASVLIGLPMMGFGGMMGGNSGGMLGYHGGHTFGWGFGLLSWAVGALLVALVGAIFAWIYNFVVSA